MSGATDYLGLITVEEGEAYDEQIFNANSEKINSHLKKMKYVTGTYTPTIAGMSTQGSGSVKSGSYVRIGKLVIASFYFKAGTSPVLGGGFITTTLPFKVANSVEKFFYGKAGLHNPGPSGSIYPIVVLGNADQSTATLYAADPNVKNVLTSPGQVGFPFAKDDVIRGTLTYLTDDA